MLEDFQRSLHEVLRSLLGLGRNIGKHKYLKSHNYHQISYEFHQGVPILTNTHELIRKY